MLLLLDGGGPSGANRKVFKEDLIHLSAGLERTIRVAHYPSYTSQWNPIEHRVFPHVERSLGGMILDSYEKVREAIARTMNHIRLVSLISSVKTRVRSSEYV